MEKKRFPHPRAIRCDESDDRFPRLQDVLREDLLLFFREEVIAAKGLYDDFFVERPCFPQEEKSLPEGDPFLKGEEETPLFFLNRGERRGEKDVPAKPFPEELPEPHGIGIARSLPREEAEAVYRYHIPASGDFRQEGSLALQPAECIHATLLAEIFFEKAGSDLLTNFTFDGDPGDGDGAVLQGIVEVTETSPRLLYDTKEAVGVPLEVKDALVEADGVVPACRLPDGAVDIEKIE